MRQCLSGIKRHWGWLKWPVAAGLLGFLFYQHWGEFKELADRRLDWYYLGVAFVLCTTSILLTFARWYLLVWAQDFPFRFSDALRLGFIGYLFSYLGPGTAGGDIVKAVMIAREQESRRSIAAATVVLDRILGLLALFMVGAFASLFQPAALLEHKVLQTIVLVLWVGSLAGLIGMGVDSAGIRRRAGRRARAPGLLHPTVCEHRKRGSHRCAGEGRTSAWYR